MSTSTPWPPRNVFPPPAVNSNVSVVAAAVPAVNWYQPYPPRGGFTYDYCIMCRDEVAEAIRKAVKSGVVEYHIGSRGLKRFTLKELQDLLAFWTNAANDAALGFPSAIQSRRAVPCDM